MSTLIKNVNREKRGLFKRLVIKDFPIEISVLMQVTLLLTYLTKADDMALLSVNIYAITLQTKRDTYIGVLEQNKCLILQNEKIFSMSKRMTDSLPQSKNTPRKT